jgi:hypothetical protein
MRRASIYLLTFVACWLVATAEAAAQDCGDWYQPMVCSAELTALDADYRTVRLEPRSSIELGPRQYIDLAVEARDQRGRRFPPERLALGYDNYDCGSLLQVEERGEGELRVSAVAAEGRCTLELWMPNNLNFAWEIDVTISVGARAGYERAEAEMVANALYAAVLNRAPDVAGYASAIAEIQSGNLETQIDAMVRSAEFRQVTSGMTPAQILEQFYQGILGRAGDSAGVRLYLGEMRRGQYASVLLKLIRSPEFERRLQR